jgi:hypothetical protein
MILQVCCRGAIFGVLVSADTSSLGLAMLGSALEEVTRPALMHLKGDILDEKQVNRRAPGGLKVICWSMRTLE